MYLSNFNGQHALIETLLLAIKEQKMFRGRYGIPIQRLLVGSYAFTIAITWSYGNSFIAYILLTVVLAGYTYFSFLKKGMRALPRGKVAIVFVVLISIFACIISFARGRTRTLQSMLMVNVSLLIPLVIAELGIDYYSIEDQLKKATIVVTIALVVLFRIKTVFNSNSLGFIVFSGISVGAIWFKLEKRIIYKMISVIFLIVDYSYILSAGSRNAAIVTVIFFIFVLIPNEIWKRKWFSRGVYLTAMAFTIFAADFMDFVLKNDDIMRYLLEYTTSFSQKAWGLDTHLTVLSEAKFIFNNLDLLSKLFGQGIKIYHTHNLFYQCLFFYGYVGTAVIYWIYARVFEIGFRLYREYDNKLALVCCIILIGHFLIQISEVYMLGAETVFLIALLPAGIILQQARPDREVQLYM